MGQEASSPIDESTPSRTLEGRTVDAVAKFIKDGRAKKIVVMAGAGISTSAGIPDFRSPETGLYANLARLNLPYAEAVFDISFFRENPLPFYALAHELYPGRYRPTIAHSFIRLLSDKNLLLKSFTQNIDCLEREAGVPDEKIVEAHGSFARQSCIDCKAPYPDDLMKSTIESKSVPHCIKESCNGLVKPEIVFFGEQLPTAFHRNRWLPEEADLCFVMGTSLTVQPFASLPGVCHEGVPRVLLNLERVGDLGSRPDDVLLLGDCDAGVRKLASALGWLDELEALWEETNPDKNDTIKKLKEEGPPTKKSRDEELEDEVEKLTGEVEESLRFSKDHQSWVREHLAESKKENSKPQTSDATAGEARESETLSDPHLGQPSSRNGTPGGEQHQSGKQTDNAPGGDDSEGASLGHVFPHLKKSSL
ncbi:MAG: hypothetical protein M1819_002476 [Sarea resinae]|nr:MAG: hypothetical protein M1819_002476 [Sarea resinae]